MEKPDGQETGDRVRDDVGAMETGPARNAGAGVPLALRRFPLSPPDASAHRHPVGIRDAALPLPLTPLSGRATEIAGVLAYIAAGARIVTLTGPGGIGKTRLALAVAERVKADLGWSVAFVDLSSVTDAALVGPTIAARFGASDAGVADAWARLPFDLWPGPTLLILDTFEPVIDAAPQISNLVQTAPPLVVLATSRVLLNLSGEHVVPVSSLSPTEAVELFVTRARAVDPEFVLTPTSLPIVKEICARLDYLPLAIELAAARTRILSPGILLDRLELPLAHLVGGPRDSPARLRTMRDAIAWSYDLLDRDERTAFRRLSVFVGGCSMESAEALCSPLPAVDAIVSLVDHSLLSPVGDGVEPRFRMLDTVRAYAFEQLEATGESVAALGTLTDYLLDRAERDALMSYSPGRDGSLAQWEADLPNVRAALGWLEATGDQVGRVRLAGALTFFWHNSAYVAEGLRWLDESGLPASAPRSIVARARIGAAGLTVLAGDPAGAETLLDQALAALGDAPGDPWHAVALLLRGVAANAVGDTTSAVVAFRQAEESAAQVPDAFVARALRRQIYSNLGVAIQRQGQYADALACHLEALRIDEELGLEPIAVNIDLGDLARSTGEWASALNRYCEALRYAGAAPSRWTRFVADAVSGCACVAAHSATPDAAARLLGAAMASWERAGILLAFPWDLASLGQTAAIVAERIGQPATDRAIEEGKSLGIAESIAIAEAVRFTQSNDEPARPPASDDQVGAVAALSLREREVLDLVVNGKSDREIADALFISVRTAQNHLRRLYGKLGVRSRAAAVAAAYAAGLYRPE